MGWFKGFGQPKKDQRIVLEQFASEQTFILEPILTPSGLVDDPTYTPGALDLATPTPVPTHWQGMMPELDHSLLLPESVDVPAHELEPLAFFHSSPDLNHGSPFTSGVFTVGSMGQVTIDYLFDGGAYRGELAIFSLEGMEQYEPGSEAFIYEAARRALSETDLGHVMVQDATEGAKYSGGLSHEGDFNSGEYRAARTVGMEAGSQFGVMLVPNGTVQQVLANPGSDGSLQPLFSIATQTGPSGQFGQLAGGAVFAFEDLNVAGASDRDFNDLVFRVGGATGGAPALEDLIDPAHDWQHSAIGQQLGAESRALVPLVGVIDTGFNSQNPHIDYRQIQGGFDCLDGDEQPLIQTGEGNEHGTQVLSVIQATQAQTFTTAVPPTPLWLGRAVGSGAWADALTQFVDHAVAAGHDHAVVNLSFDLTQVAADGTLMPRTALTTGEWAALTYAQQHGVLVVASAGNDGGLLSALGQAAQQFDNVITVGAVEGVTRADYSGWGPGLTLLASGGTATAPLQVASGEGLTATYGTSFATAQVTGVIAQLWQVNPALNYGQVVDILKQSATDLGEPGWDAQTGAGVLNVVAALELAGQTPGQSLPLPLPVTPPALPLDPPTFTAGGEQPTDETPAPAAGNATALAGNTHLLWRNTTTGDNAIWVMNGTSLVSFLPVTPAVSTNWTLAGTGDFNGDGRTDFLWRDQATGANGVWMMDGSHFLSAVALNPVSTNWILAGAGDFNDDGQTDLLWREPAAGVTGLWLMDGTSVMSTASLPAGLYQGWGIEGIADFNRDGHTDILWRYYPDGHNGIWFMNGTTIASSSSVTSVSSPWQIGGWAI